MKVTTEHYSLIKEQFENIITKVMSDKGITKEEIFAEYEKAYSDYTETRKIWDFYWIFTIICRKTSIDQTC